MKDVIKSGGEWVSSLALESIASGVSGVGEVAAIGMPDVQWGERPLLLIVGRGFDRGALSKRRSRAFARGGGRKTVKMGCSKRYQVCC